MAPQPALVIFLGGLGESEVEKLVAGARAATVVDCVKAALGGGRCDRAVVAIDGRTRLPELPDGVVIDVDDGPFHFGSRLAEIVRKYGLERIIYLGGGSLPLLGANEFDEVSDALSESTVVTNNHYSSDLVAFVSSALTRIEPPDSDNGLARTLSEEAGLSVHALPRSVATQLDIDGPTDLAVLRLTGEGGSRLREYLKDHELELTRYRRVLPLLTDRSAQITVAGRVGSHAWQYLESETACRVRLFAEERGMEADGRAVAGQARSLLGFFLDQVGSRRAFDALAELGDAAIIDTRVILAHFGVSAGRSDRFLSDLGRWEAVSEPFLRDFTRAAVEASIPVLLGGHSLVSGGLMALNEFAWRKREASGAASTSEPPG